MNDIFLLILGFLLIFISIVLTFLRLKSIKLTIEDYGRWRKIESKINLFKSKFLKIIKLSENEFRYMIHNFLEKTLMRIKIEALKIETWAAKKLEKLKKNNSESI